MILGIWSLFMGRAIILECWFFLLLGGFMIRTDEADAEEQAPDVMHSTCQDSRDIQISLRLDIFQMESFGRPKKNFVAILFITYSVSAL